MYLKIATVFYVTYIDRVAISTGLSVILMILKRFCEEITETSVSDNL